MKPSDPPRIIGANDAREGKTPFGQNLFLQEQQL